MKIRRLTIEVEVPWAVKAGDVEQALGHGIANWYRDGLNYVPPRPLPPCQIQVVSDVVSSNTQIGDVTTWPPK